MLSVFDLFKIGIGPSSSHTVGPMRAAKLFVEELKKQHLLLNVNRVKVTLYGSLAATGIGHASDRAVMLGLMGETPEQVCPEEIGQFIARIQRDYQIVLLHEHTVGFNPQKDLIFDRQFLSYHPNTMILQAYNRQQEVYSNTYYSVGGGFVVDAQQVEDGAQSHQIHQFQRPVPYVFDSAKALLHKCREHHLSISSLMMANEKSVRSENDIRQGLMEIWHVMKQCVQAGIMHYKGILPGGLGVIRRAPLIYQSLQQESPPHELFATFSAMEWVNLFALAVAEENAAGGRVVTAPTNGAAGVIPAVLHYFMKFHTGACDDDVIRFLLSAAAIGILCKTNASISGAEVGCQGEIGSACAMAAAGLAEVMNATPEQVENAAEIALEHNLGLTCDPVAGLVQIPCIERNVMAAVKAINAVQLALRGNGSHLISLDKAIYTMKITGRDMSEKYKETSLGGLADNNTVC